MSKTIGKFGFDLIKHEKDKVGHKPSLPFNPLLMITCGDERISYHLMTAGEIDHYIDLCIEDLESVRRQSKAALKAAINAPITT
jgi:hypothetical protein